MILVFISMKILMTNLGTKDKCGEKSRPDLNAVSVKMHLHQLLELFKLSSESEVRKIV